MGKTRNTGFSNNAIQYNNGSIAFVSGSTTLLNISSSGAIVTTGTITANTLVVQTVTSSVDFVTGSTRFGSLLANTHTFTGSMNLTGSLTVTTTGTELQVNANGVKFGNVSTDTHTVTGSMYVTGAFYVPTGSIGIGTVSPSQLLEVVGGEIKAGRVDSSNEGGQVSFGRSTDNATAWYIDAYGNVASPQLRFVDVSGAAVRMTLTGSNVGIGTSSPSSIFEVAQTNGIITQRGNTGYSVFRSYGGDGTNSDVVEFQIRNRVDGSNMVSIGNFTSHDLTFRTANTERMRITSGGKLCVGRTATIFANARHTIDGNTSSGGEPVLEVYNSNLSDAAPAIACIKNSATTNSSARFMQFYSDGGNIAMGGIVGNGSTNVQFFSISDIREKENIISINGSLNKLLALNPVEFDWIKSKEHTSAGFIAQEVEKIFPEYVVENACNNGEEDRKGLTGGMTSGIIAHLVKAIQELKADNDALKTRIETLENK